MNPVKRTYADVLKAPFPALNPRLTAEPLISKPVRARLTESAKSNLRAIIHNEATTALTEHPVIYPDVKKGVPRGLVKSQKSKEATQQPITNWSQPLILAKASDWVVPGFIMSESIKATKKSSSNVSLLKPEEIAVEEKVIKKTQSMCVTIQMTKI